MPADFTYTLRRATEHDAATIKAMVREENLDPTSLGWRNFTVAQSDGQVIGIGQIKELPGCQELGSLMVREPYRKHGVAAALIAALEARASRPLYLMCEQEMGRYYSKFGYKTISWWRSPWPLKMKRLIVLPWLILGYRFQIMVKTV